ncbi:MAG: amino acid racemase [Ruminococcaceae bacterium]|nr:amino acid racemase [Oscillospiraceae bacterium]
MKKIGLMGGLGPASTIEYYKGLVELSLSQFGAEKYPQIVIDSVDMAEHTKYFNEHDYQKIGDLIYESLCVLKNAGAQVAAITANTEHIAWDYVKDRLPLKAISIVDATVEECLKRGYQRIVVFATEWTLRSGLYANAFIKAGITPIVPDGSDISALGNLIYPNLENGIVIDEDKEKMISLAEKYIESGSADALLLGCTEIPLMINQGDVSVPIIDTTQIHIKALYNYAISDNNE